MLRAIGWPETVFRFALYAFATALMVVRIGRHTHSVAGLSALRAELLAPGDGGLGCCSGGLRKPFTMKRRTKTNKTRCA